MTTVADCVVDQLINAGVECVFGVVGGAIEPLMNAIARREQAGLITYIAAMHETDAAYMADGYFRATGKIAALVATSGPGATNLITGLASAYENRIPMYVYIGIPSLRLHGSGPIQGNSAMGASAVAAVSAVVKYCSVMQSPEQLPQFFRVQVACVSSMPYSPAVLAIPLNVQQSECILNHSTLAQELMLARASRTVSDNRIAKLCSSISQAKSVLLLIGVDALHCIPLLEPLAAFMRARIAVTPDAKGYIRTNAPGYLGVLGFAGHECVNEFLAEKPDFIVALGVRFGEWSSNLWSPLLMHERLIAVSPDDEIHIRLGGRPQSICMDSHDFCIQAMHIMQEWSFLHERKTVAVLGACADTEETAELQPVSPQALMRALSKNCKEHAGEIVVFADAGSAMAWTVRHMECVLTQPVKHPWHIVITEFLGMGWAIGASVGYAFGLSRSCTNIESSTVFCITGDGSYLMSGQEILVAKALNLPLVFVILNDGGYGMVRHGQQLGGAESIGHAISDVNFALMARALGVASWRIKNTADLNSFDFSKIPQNAPCLIDVCIDRNEIPPIRQRVTTLHEKDIPSTNTP